jgi:hypothetical protein
MMTEIENDIASFEPAADEILAESRNFQIPPDAARESLIEKRRAKSQRLADFAPAASLEISEALAQADAARERAENLMAEQQATLDGITSAIIAVGTLRKKIRLLQSLTLNTATEKHLAETALNYFILKSESATPQNVSGFQTFADDLAWRKALSAHIPAFVAPLETQVSALIAKIKAEARESKMDLKKVFQLFAAERGHAGEPVLLDAALYEGLI